MRMTLPLSTPIFPEMNSRDVFSSQWVPSSALKRASILGGEQPVNASVTVERVTAFNEAILVFDLSISLSGSRLLVQSSTNIDLT